LELAKVLESANIQTFFSLSWVITWFAHDIKDIKVLGRMFDAFIVSHVLLPLYVAVALISNPVVKKGIVDIFESGTDPTEIYSFLKKAPLLITHCDESMMSADSLISAALDIMEIHPPYELLRTQEASQISDTSIVWQGNTYPWYPQYKDRLSKADFVRSGLLESLLRRFKSVKLPIKNNTSSWIGFVLCPLLIALVGRILSRKLSEINGISEAIG